jgi:hypothetical protein
VCSQRRCAAYSAATGNYITVPCGKIQSRRGHTTRQNQWHSAWSKIFERFQRFCAIQRAHCNSIFGAKVTDSPFLRHQTAQYCTRARSCAVGPARPRTTAQCSRLVMQIRLDTYEIVLDMHLTLYSWEVTPRSLRDRSDIVRSVL